MSQLKEALKKKLERQFKISKFTDEDLDAMADEYKLKIKEKRRLAKEKGKLYR